MKKHNKQTDPWSNTKTLYAAIVLVVLLSVFSLYASNLTISPKGKFTQTQTCYDTDGLNFDAKGTLIITHGNDILMSKSDECINNKLMEYACNPDDISTYISTLEHCTCEDDRCVG